MKSLGSSSAILPPPQSPNAPSRKAFSLTGRSIRLDPRHHAVRADLADLRLADQVFAPHYAAPMPRVLTEPATLAAGRDPGSDPIASLGAGDLFEVLDLIGDRAWGRAARQDLVGYLPQSVLGRPE